MSRSIAFAAMAALLATPVFAGPAPKRFTCPLAKAATRDAKRAEPCRRPTIPPVIDPTPLFLASTAAPHVTLSDLS